MFVCKDHDQQAVGYFKTFLTSFLTTFSDHCETSRGPVDISSTNGAVTAGRNLVSRSHNIFPDTATFGRPGAGRGGWSEPHLSTTNVQHFVTVTEQ